MNVWLRIERLSSRTKVRRTWVKQGFVYITGCLLASTLGTAVLVPVPALASANFGATTGKTALQYWRVPLVISGVQL
jgi:hypothetical protein